MTTPAEPPRDTDISRLAPLFAARVAETLSRARLAGLDPIIYEAFRSDERQRWLYGVGRTHSLTRDTVTNAQSALYSWHGYGLAVDVISRSKLWADESFFERLALIAKAAGLDWGGDWSTRDLPHFQFSTLRAGPSARGRALMKSGGLLAVWKEVGAI
jgi:peptidoglycan LD-endopeptidase CwlK